MADLRTKIAFSMANGLTSGLADNLLDRIGDEESLFTQSAAYLKEVCHLPDKIASDSARRYMMHSADTEQRFAASKGIDTLYYRDCGYPTRLAECSDAPIMLYKLGPADLDARHIVGIVGTRQATAYGVDITTRIVNDLADKLDNLVVVSGLAYGIDVAAHKAALARDIPTVAVCAHPLNTVYPAEHRNIAARIIQAGGAMVTEYPTTSIVHRANFLQRNRIVAGLCDVLIVVESDSKGGSMTTARLASAYNREVYAVPGRVTDRYSRGCNSLIATNSAHIYTCVDDIAADMQWTCRTPPGTQLQLPLSLTPDEQITIDFLTANPASTVSEISVSTGIAVGKLKDILFNLEMDDRIMSIAGGKYTVLAT